MIENVMTLRTEKYLIHFNLEKKRVYYKYKDDPTCPVDKVDLATGVDFAIWLTEFVGDLLIYEKRSPMSNEMEFLKLVAMKMYDWKESVA